MHAAIVNKCMCDLLKASLLHEHRASCPNRLRASGFVKTAPHNLRPKARPYVGYRLDGFWPPGGKMVR